MGETRDRIRIVETVTGATMVELRAARDAVRAADLIELRLDGVRDVDVAGALEGRTTPVIVTCRPVWEGGRFDGAEDDRLRLLAQAVTAGAEFVDVEWKADRARLAALTNCANRADAATRLVISHHDFNGVPADAAARVAAMRGDAPDAVLKFAVTTPTLTDVERLADATATLSGQRIVIGMGSAGTITRVCPWLFGSAWTYAGNAAPGQLSTQVLNESYRVREGSRARQLFAVTGAPLGHSASPAMHNAAFAALGLDMVYVPLESSDPKEFLRAAERFGVEGASVTAPMKLGWNDAGVELGDDAREAGGAVNTLVRAGARWAGRNFDVDGFLDPLDARGMQLAGMQALVLGAGGAARASARALVSRGAIVAISSRRPDAVAGVAATAGAGTAPWPPAGDFDLLVNATPVGTHPHVHEMPVALDELNARLVYDLIYNPRETALLRAARQRGSETIGGLEMLVGQARRQFELWTGQRAPVDVMTRAASAFIAASSPQALTL